MLMLFTLVVALASEAFAAGPACQRSPYNMLAPLSSYSSASAYCYSKFPVAAVTTTSTYTPTSTVTTVVAARVTVKATSTSVTTVSYTSTVSTVFIQKREPAVDSSSSLSSRWRSVSSVLSRSGTAAFSTACSCIETAKTVSKVATAAAVVKRVSSTSTSTRTSIVKVVQSTKSVMVPATATATAPGSCSSLGSSFKDNAGATYNVFCKISYARSDGNTISTKTNVATFKDCIQQCSSTTGCAAVDYARADAKCFLLSINTPLSKAADTTTDCAANTNPPPAPGSADSLPKAYQPEDSSLTFTIAFGNVYSYQDSSVISSTNTPNFQTCVDSCANSRKCLLAFRSRSTGVCMLFNQALQPQSKKLRIRDGATPTDGDSAALDASALTPCSALSKPYTSANGSAFNFDCNGINIIGPHYELIMSSQTGRDFSECMDVCSGTAGCVATTYFPSANASNNICYLLKDILFGIDPATNVNSAILASYPVPPTNCTAISAVGPTMMADGNRTFTPQCGQSYDPSTNFRNDTDMPSFKICVFQCSTFKQCQAVDYDETTGLCMLMTSGSGNLTATAGHDVATITPDQLQDPGSCTISNDPYTTSNGQRFDTTCNSWIPLPGDSHFQNYDPTYGIASFAQCLETCSTTSGCQAVDWDRANKVCILMERPVSGQFANAVVATTDGKDFAKLIPAPGSCQSLGADYTSANGSVFEMKCGYKPSFGPEDIVIIRDSNDMSNFNFQACVDACSTDDGCTVASFNGTHCMSLYYDAYSNVMSMDTTYDTARMEHPPTQCLGVDTPYTSASNDMYDIHCYHYYPEAGRFADGNATSFQACMDSCSTYGNCVGVNYWFEENPTVQCDLFAAPIGTGHARGNAMGALRRMS